MGSGKQWLGQVPGKFFNVTSEEVEIDIKLFDRKMIIRFK